MSTTITRIDIICGSTNNKYHPLSLKTFALIFRRTLPAVSIIQLRFGVDEGSLFVISQFIIDNRNNFLFFDELFRICKLLNRRLPNLASSELVLDFFGNKVCVLSTIICRFDMFLSVRRVFFFLQTDNDLVHSPLRNKQISFKLNRQYTQQ